MRAACVALPMRSSPDMCGVEAGGQRVRDGSQHLAGDQLLPHDDFGRNCRRGGGVRMHMLAFIETPVDHKTRHTSYARTRAHVLHMTIQCVTYDVGQGDAVAIEGGEFVDEILAIANVKRSGCVC